MQVSKIGDIRMKITNRNITPYYTLLQCLYWAVSCLMINFASVFLLNRGFSNSAIGLVLGFCYAFSAVMQPAIAGFMRRHKLRLSNCLSGIICINIVLASAIYFLPLKGAVLGVVIMCMFMLQSSMQPSINSLHRGYELEGLQVNFGFARGMGSVSFAVVTFVTGQLLKVISPNTIPAMYLVGLIILLVCMYAFRTPVFSVEEQASGEKGESLLKRHPHFALFLAGLVLLSMAHIFLDHFMLQIMMTIGGDSANLGIAIAVAAIVELPAMMVYKRLSKKAGPGKLLIMAGWAWVAKNLLIMLARTPEAVYAAEVLQCLSYAIYVPATVDYIGRNLPEGDFLRAQAWSGSAFTMGSLLATIIGGPMIDLIGVRAMVALIQLVSISGAILFTIALKQKKHA